MAATKAQRVLKRRMYVRVQTRCLVATFQMGFIGFLFLLKRTRGLDVTWSQVELDFFCRQGNRRFFATRGTVYVHWTGSG